MSEERERFLTARQYGTVALLCSVKAGAQRVWESSLETSQITFSLLVVKDRTGFSCLGQFENTPPGLLKQGAEEKVPPQQ